MSWLFGSGNKEDRSQSEDHRELGFDPSQVTNVSSIFRTPGTLDASRLHPLAGLDKGVEYLDLEEEQLNDIEGSRGLIPSRSWTDDLCYGTGTVYLLGLGIGGLYGVREAFKDMPKSASPKLQLNTVLNHVTKRGPFLGNSAGVLAMTYNLLDSSLDYFRGKHDDLNSIGAGTLAGAIFKSSAGFKPMGYSTGMMAGAAALWVGFKHLVA